MSLPRGLTLSLYLTLTPLSHPTLSTFRPQPLILKVSTALQSVFLATNRKRDDPPTPTFCYDRSVLRFSFACGLRPHAKLNPRTLLA